MSAFSMHRPQKTHEEREKTGWKRKKSEGFSELTDTHQNSKSRVRVLSVKAFICACTVCTRSGLLSVSGRGKEVVDVCESLVDPVNHTSCGPLSHLEETYFTGALQYVDCRAYEVNTDRATI